MKKKLCKISKYFWKSQHIFEKELNTILKNINIHLKNWKLKNENEKWKVKNLKICLKISTHLKKKTQHNFEKYQHTFKKLKNENDATASKLWEDLGLKARRTSSFLQSQHPVSISFPRGSPHAHPAGGSILSKPTSGAQQSGECFISLEQTSIGGNCRVNTSKCSWPNSG